MRAGQPAGANVNQHSQRRGAGTAGGTAPSGPSRRVHAHASGATISGSSFSNRSANVSDGRILSLWAGGVGELDSPGGRAEPLQWRPVVPRVGELAVADLERGLLGLKNTLGFEREPASMRGEVGAERVSHQLGTPCRFGAGQRRG